MNRMLIASSSICNGEQHVGPTTAFDTMCWDQPCREQHSAEHSTAMPKQKVDVAAQQQLPLRLSMKHNVFKPAKKAAEQALCWLLDIERNPKKPISLVAGESTPNSVQTIACQNRVGFATHTKCAIFNGIRCRKFSMDDEVNNEIEEVGPLRFDRNRTSTAPCTGGVFFKCARQQDEIGFDDNKLTRAEANKRELEELVKNLFRLHDLNKNGFLEEAELIQLNKKIAMLHSGKDVDKVAVTEKYQNLFRSELDPTGQPVSYDIFAKYMHQVLDGIDPDITAQIMIMEQFALEASAARKFFRIPSFESKLDAPFVRYISFESTAEKLNEFNKLSEECEEFTDQMYAGL